LLQKKLNLSSNYGVKLFHSNLFSCGVSPFSLLRLTLTRIYIHLRLCYCCLCYGEPSPQCINRYEAPPYEMCVGRPQWVPWRDDNINDVMTRVDAAIDRQTRGRGYTNAWWRPCSTDSNQTVFQTTRQLKRMAQNDKATEREAGVTFTS